MYLILSIIILISFIIFCSCVYYSRKTNNANHGAKQITEVLSLITAIITFISSISSIFLSSYEIINSNSNTNTNQNNNIIINKIDIPTSETESQTKEQIVNQIKLAVQTNDYEELALLLENEKVEALWRLHLIFFYRRFHLQYKICNYPGYPWNNLYSTNLLFS